MFKPRDAEQSPGEHSSPTGLRKTEWGCQLLPRLLTGIQIQKKESPLETLCDPMKPRHPSFLLTLQPGHPGGV